MYVFDLEGTLSDCRHRLHLLPSKEEKIKCNRQYDAYEKFHSKFMDDPVRENILRLYNICAAKGRIIILTGMMEKNVRRAEKWLYNNKIRYDELIMRRENDFSTSPEYKLRELRYSRHRATMVFDDRVDVVDHLLTHGIPAIVV